MILAQRVHLFPFRTQKLSSAEATILAWRRAGKIAQCQHHPIQLTQLTPVSCIGLYTSSGLPIGDFHSSLAQSVEHLTVNQGVVGSSPTGGAIKALSIYAPLAQLVEQLTLNQWVPGSNP